MTVHYKTRGFVFKKEDRMDSDRLFSVFTKDLGRLELFGKGIRKITSKLRGNMELFYISDIEFIQGKNRKTLTDAQVLKKYYHLQASPEKMHVASTISNMLDTFIKGQEPDEKIWQLVSDFFQKLNDPLLPLARLQLAQHYFFWNFVSVLGYAPQLSHCAMCQESLHPDFLYFSLTS